MVSYPQQKPFMTHGKQPTKENKTTNQPADGLNQINRNPFFSNSLKSVRA
jgi:hypothetical protein